MLNDFARVYITYWDTLGALELDASTEAEVWELALANG